MTDLEHVIDTAWETRSTLSPQNAPAAVGDAVGQVIAGARCRALARRREDRRCLDDAPVDQEGGAAVVPPDRNRRHAFRAPRRQRRAVRVLRQGADQVRRPVRRPARRHRRQGRAAGRRAPRRLHRAERRADAVLREHRRLRRRGHDGRHAGRPWARARRSAGTCIFQAVWASAACSSRCRPIPRSSRTTASSARARKWSRA